MKNFLPTINIMEISMCVCFPVFGTYVVPMCGGNIQYIQHKFSRNPASKKVNNAEKNREVN